MMDGHCISFDIHPLAAIDAYAGTSFHFDRITQCARAKISVTDQLRATHARCLETRSV